MGIEWGAHHWRKGKVRQVVGDTTVLNTAGTVHTNCPPAKLSINKNIYTEKNDFVIYQNLVISIKFYKIVTLSYLL